MRRREFVQIAATAAVWPVAARGQQNALSVVGYLGSASPDLYAPAVSAFREGLSEAGLVEGRNLAIEFRWAQGENERLPALAADLVRRQVSVIATPGSTPAAMAAKAATATIPIVFQIGSDPVAAGLVASLSRPGGNATGLTTLNTEVGAKRLQLLHEMVPAAHVIALLINPTSSFIAEAVSKDVQSAAQALGLQLHILQASAERDFETVFANLRQLRAEALMIAPDAFFIIRASS